MAAHTAPARFDIDVCKRCGCAGSIPIPHARKMQYRRCRCGACFVRGRVCPHIPCHHLSDEELCRRWRLDVHHGVGVTSRRCVVASAQLHRRSCYVRFGLGGSADLCILSRGKSEV